MNIARIRRTYATAAAIGWENLPRRVWHVARVRSGVLRRSLPGGEPDANTWRRAFTDGYTDEAAGERWRERAARWFAPPAAQASLAAAHRTLLNDDAWRAATAHELAGLRRGVVRFFQRDAVEVGDPPDFARDAMHDVRWPTGRHWSDYDTLDPQFRDIKCLWEPARFTWAYLLAREHVRTGDDEPARRFWRWLEAWDQQNPYGLTAQWICGQEATFRMMAWLFAAFAMLNSTETTAPRLARLTRLVWLTGRHIDGAIDYARSQKNNHAISESAGLLAIGLLFPEFRAAHRWATRGRRILNAELRRQIYRDGSYVQHSVTYHRVMLDDAVWAGRLAELHGKPLDPKTLDVIGRATDWLGSLVEASNGRAPNYGSNDGALILPLSTCDYLDFRPVVQAAHYFVHRRRCFDGPAGSPWDEQLLWLFGADALTAAVETPRQAAVWRADTGGYYVVRGPRSHVFTRVHAYRDRPSQCDMLHVDLWADGVNVLRDAGSYHYNADAAWKQYFPSTGAHNTVEIDGRDQMERGPRFLWLHWTRSRLIALETTADERVSLLIGEHDGYQRLASGKVTHRRTLLRIDDAYMVMDDVLGAGTHDVTLRWRLVDADWVSEDDCAVGGGWSVSAELTGGGGSVDLRVRAPVGFDGELVRGVEAPAPEGWESLYYAEKTPLPVFRVRGRAEAGARFVTVIRVGASAPRLEVSPAAGDGAIAIGGVPSALRGEVGALLRAACADVVVGEGGRK